VHEKEEDGLTEAVAVLLYKPVTVMIYIYIYIYREREKTINLKNLKSQLHTFWVLKSYEKLLILLLFAD